jgi:carbohydrate-binding DOMON domain-containing protein
MIGAKSYIGQGDVGVKIIGNLNHNLHDAAGLQFLVATPDNRQVAVTATVYDINLGKIKYVSKQGDFDKPGKYLFAGNVVFTDGSSFTGNTHEIWVRPTFG